ncbi:SapC family protein [Marinobacterium sp. AK62]|uniref:SapC family protein n=1 Tax=Marinobacterium alkalitolerans TaxID=1542925 RepID=A0ABS3ZDE6_9GAMM|nr:SapC family protein [Marinobacterium alkalitolerans]MBP0049729.1 SapC family protein [Marinobacterium alkalitolerans]
MPKYQPITKTSFAHLKWQPCKDFRFAAKDNLVPLVAQELPTACINRPIAFIKLGDNFVPAAIQSLQPGLNLHVGTDGQWLIPYIPALYRGYPFLLLQTKEEQQVLCVDTDSGLISEQGEHRFFEDDGQPTAAVNEVVEFLKQVQHNRELTKRLCTALDAEGLIVPWSIKVKDASGQEHPVQGLFRVDEARFNALDGEAAARLHQSGALPVVYCQLISMQHMQVLARLAESRTQQANTEAPAEVDIEAMFGGGDDTLKFDF